MSLLNLRVLTSTAIEPQCSDRRVRRVISLFSQKYSSFCHCWTRVLTEIFIKWYHYWTSVFWHQCWSYGITVEPLCTDRSFRHVVTTDVPYSDRYISHNVVLLKPLALRLIFVIWSHYWTTVLTENIRHMLPLLKFHVLTDMFFIMYRYWNPVSWQHYSSYFITTRSQCSDRNVYHLVSLVNLRVLTDIFFIMYHDCTPVSSQQYSS
jgi:hypothetical protein